MLLYHHNRALDSVIYGTVRANPEYACEEFRDAYLWLEKEIGFYPTFLAVGKTENDINMTGYQDQWRKQNSPKDNYVLFSFENVTGVFMDFDWWHVVLNSRDYSKITKRQKQRIFKYSWSNDDWLRKVRLENHPVQIVAPEINLSEAGRIWVRNKKTKKSLESLGFENIEVKRLLY